MKLHRFALVSLFVSLGAIGSAQADTWVSQPGTIGLAGTHLGTSIAIGDYTDPSCTSVCPKLLGSLYVGAPKQNVGAVSEAGVVYVFTPSAQGWVYATTLSSGNPQPGAHFGASIAYSSGRLLVGEPDVSVNGITGAGGIEFFSDNEDPPSKSPVTRIDGRFGNGGHFGRAVAIQGTFAAVSRINDADGNGCVDIFRNTEFTSLWSPFGGFPACGTGGEELGASVAIRTTSPYANFILVAGAPASTQNSQALAGVAHVFVENAQGTGVVEISTLTAQNPAFLDVFGTSVGIDATYIYVGGTGRDNGAGRVGSVTIFKQGSIFGYNYLAEYFPGTPATIGGHCGASLSVDAVNSQFILGCPNSNGTSAGEGTARVYRQFQFLGQTVWLESLLSFGNSLHGADALGSSVAIYGDHAFAGAPNANFPSPQTGNGRWLEFVPDKIFQDGFGG